MSAISSLRKEQSTYQRAYERVGCWTRFKRTVTYVAKTGVDVCLSCSLSAVQKVVARTGTFLCTTVLQNNTAKKEMTAQPIEEDNPRLLERLSSNASTLGLRKRIRLEWQGSDHRAVHSPVETESHSLNSQCTLTCAPQAYLKPEVLSALAQAQPSQMQQEQFTEFAEHPEFAEFFGTQALVHALRNTPIILSAIEIAAEFACCSALEQAAAAQEYDVSTWSFAIASGLIARSLALLTSRLARRYAIFSADSIAASLLEHPKEARRALECIAKVPRPLLSLLPSPE